MPFSPTTMNNTQFGSPKKVVIKKRQVEALHHSILSLKDHLDLDRRFDFTSEEKE
jgi:hypothetical protein